MRVEHRWIDPPDAAGPDPRRGQMYVLGMHPDRADGIPLVLVHGGGGQGVDFLGTPDGRDGWACRFVGTGHPVYVVDRPGHGRSAGAAPWLTARTGAAALTEDDARALIVDSDGHVSDRWPAGAERSFSAGLVPFSPDAASIRAERILAVELLRQVGPAAIVCHSAGAAMAWAAAAETPRLVEAIVAVEPAIPRLPALDLMGVPVEWAALSDVPVRILVAPRSPMRALGVELDARLRERGVPSVLVDLAQWGIEGNGHMMMLESNSDDLADVVRGLIPERRRTSRG